MRHLGVRTGSGGSTAKVTIRIEIYSGTPRNRSSNDLVLAVLLQRGHRPVVAAGTADLNGNVGSGFHGELNAIVVHSRTDLEIQGSLIVTVLKSIGSSVSRNAEVAGVIHRAHQQRLSVRITGGVHGRNGGGELIGLRSGHMALFKGNVDGHGLVGHFEGVDVHFLLKGHGLSATIRGIGDFSHLIAAGGSGGHGDGGALGGLSDLRAAHGHGKTTVGRGALGNGVLGGVGITRAIGNFNLKNLSLFSGETKLYRTSRNIFKCSNSIGRIALCGIGTRSCGSAASSPNTQFSTRLRHIPPHLDCSLSGRSKIKSPAASVGIGGTVPFYGF